MVDVTTENFEKLLPEILADIKSAVFVAVDAEFTGLSSSNSYDNSIFDDGNERYAKQRENLDRITICQLGLAAYKGIPDTNGYTVTSYNFYLRPHSCGSIDPIFVCQTSGIEFLRKYQFDFNKWLYDGLPFLNRDEADSLSRELQSIVEGKENLQLSDELRDRVRTIGDWANTAQDNDTSTVSVPLSGTSKLLLVIAVRNLLMDVWARIDNGKVVVQKVSETEKKKLDAVDSEKQKLVSALLEKFEGFSIVFKYLAELQKPLILHNCFLDLMLIYKQFHRNLPPSYKTFKTDLHQMFPLIYDTKFVASELRYEYKNSDRKAFNIFIDTGLGSLAASLKNELPVLYRPSHTHLPKMSKYLQNGASARLHEAGYDAYLTGFCFISMAHLHAMLQMPSRTQQRPLSPREHLYAVKNLANRIQMRQSRVKYINLAGHDPVSRRPPWLLVQSRQGCWWSRLSPSLVSSSLSHFGSIDVRSHGRSSVLVATTSWKRTSDIKEGLANDRYLKAQVYNKFRHSSTLRTLGWSVGLVSTSLSAWLFYNTFKKALT
ncbi:hypothetical protein Pmani_009610 [Petrolisthes manimaculis]|uniref:Uncharacterized protein n=1 Tax=Petrolisthes manimaculis TaxID=1843537 RepID=A0AAE1Q3X6_9EUCA|nr:hypothetical protein Pmani_009610 [Petrolisthes manimaculis]